MLRIFQGIILLSLLASCHKVPPHTATVGGVRNARAILVERTLKESESRIKTLRGLANAVLVDKDEERTTDLALVIARPNRIRADAVDALADVWAAAGTDGRRLWLWLPNKGKLYRGAATPGNLKRLAAFDWEVPELVSIVAGLVPGARHAELAWVEGKNHYAMSDRPIHLWVDPKTRNPVRLVRYKSPPLCKGREGGVDLPPLTPPYPPRADPPLADKGGVAEECAVQYEVKFSDYRKVGDGDFPHAIEVDFPERDCTLYLHYREVEFNAEVDSSLFKPEDVWRSQTVEEMDK